MKTMLRNLKSVWYCNYLGKEPMMGDDGYETGEYRVVYSDPVEIRCNVSASKGAAQNEMFGNLDASDRVLVIDEITLPINENTVMFIDKEPEFDNDGSPLYDYRVLRVGVSLNSTSIAVSKVVVS